MAGAKEKSAERAMLGQENVVTFTGRELFERYWQRTQCKKCAWAKQSENVWHIGNAAQGWGVTD